MFRQLRNKKAFDRAQTQANDGEFVCGTLVDDQPVYFVMPADASDEEVRAKAFEMRNKRTMNHVERTLLDIVESTRV